MKMTRPDRLPFHSTGAARAPEPERCVSCGLELATPFCAWCGEQRASDRRYSLLHFGAEVLESFASFDGTLLRTVKTLVARPGALTAAYMRGERARYTRPLQLFVLVSVASFFLSLAANVHTFDTPLWVHMAQWSGPADRVAQRVAERHTTVAQYAERFDQTSTTQAKSLIIAMVPVFAVLVALLEIRKRRFALEHLVFALHAYTAMLVLMMATDCLALPAVRPLLRGIMALLRTGGDGVLSLLDIGGIFAYLVLALRRSYGDRRLVAAAKALVLVVGMILILQAYRYVLFYTTFWAT